jgi:hypothetical protein
MALTKEDVEAILEATRPKPLQDFSSRQLWRSGPKIPSGGYAELLKLREQTEKKKLRRPRGRLPRAKPKD